MAGPEPIMYNQVGICPNCDTLLLLNHCTLDKAIDKLGLVGPEISYKTVDTFRVIK
jgi:hypothetical protein